MLGLLFALLITLLILGLIDLLVRKAPIDAEIKTYLRYVILVVGVVYFIYVLAGLLGVVPHAGIYRLG